MRRLVIVGALALVVTGGVMGTAQADLGEPTERVVRKHFCEMTVEAGGFVNEFNCEGAEHQVEGVTSLVEGVSAFVVGEVCTTHTFPDGSIGTVDCDGPAHQVEGVTSLVTGVTNEVVCGDLGADLDCRGYERDAERAERNTARTADRALRDAGF